MQKKYNQRQYMQIVHIKEKILFYNNDLIKINLRQNICDVREFLLNILTWPMLLQRIRKLCPCISKWSNGLVVSQISKYQYRTLEKPILLYNY